MELLAHPSDECLLRSLMPSRSDTGIEGFEHRGLLKVWLSDTSTEDPHSGSGWYVCLYHAISD